MNKFKKGVLDFIMSLGSRKTKKKEKFDNKVLNLTLQKIDSDSFKFDGKAVYTADMSVLVYVFNTDEDFTIPPGVEIIGMMAFRNKGLLKNVIIPSSVKVIEKNAFYGCDELDKVIIPDTVESVKANAFAACNSLQTVTFAGTMKGLNRHAFDDSNNLRLIVVPSGSVDSYCKALHINNDNTVMKVVEKTSRVRNAAEKKKIENEEEGKTGEVKKAEKTRKTPIKRRTGKTKEKSAKQMETESETEGNTK